LVERLERLLLVVGSYMKEVQTKVYASARLSSCSQHPLDYLVFKLV
jgi:hypothetical protein